MPGERDFAAEATPDRIAGAIAEQVAAAGGSLPHSHHEGAQPQAVSVRTLSYRGHEVVIRTKYEIEVDGRPFSPQITVDMGGRVHYHGLPTRDFASMVDLVRKAIDTFPADFQPGAWGEPGGHHHPGGGGESH